MPVSSTSRLKGGNANKGHQIVVQCFFDHSISGSCNCSARCPDWSAVDQRKSSGNSSDPLPRLARKMSQLFDQPYEPSPPLWPCTVLVHAHPCRAFTLTRSTLYANYFIMRILCQSCCKQGCLAWETIEISFDGDRQLLPLANRFRYV